jgi:hypothetical protein
MQKDCARALLLCIFVGCNSPLGIASYKKIRRGIPTYQNVPKCTKTYQTYNHVSKRTKCTDRKCRALLVISSAIDFALFGTFFHIFRDKKRVGFDIIKKPIDISNTVDVRFIVQHATFYSSFARRIRAITIVTRSTCFGTLCDTTTQRRDASSFGTVDSPTLRERRQGVSCHNKHLLTWTNEQEAKIQTSWTF